MPDERNQNSVVSDSTDALLRQMRQLLDEPWTPELEPEQTPPEQPADAPQAPTQVPKKPRSSRSEQLLLVHDIVYILAAVVLVFTFFVRVSRVEGDSMYPTLVHHDRMLLLSSVWYQEPQRGDIVVARVPEFSRDPLVKRVIAVEGDTVNIDFNSGIVYVNGTALEEDYINERTYTQFYENGLTFPVTIEQGHVFLMGDNRNDSYDSRYAAIGQVDQRCILGKAILIAFPGNDVKTGNRDFSRIGIVDGK